MITGWLFCVQGWTPATGGSVLGAYPAWMNPGWSMRNTAGYVKTLGRDHPGPGHWSPLGLLLVWTWMHHWVSLRPYHSHLQWAEYSLGGDRIEWGDPRWRKQGTHNHGTLGFLCGYYCFHLECLYLKIQGFLLDSWACLSFHKWWCDSMFGGLKMIFSKKN